MITGAFAVEKSIVAKLDYQNIVKMAKQSNNADHLSTQDSFCLRGRKREV
jgi:hypothetical protein